MGCTRYVRASALYLIYIDIGIKRRSSKMLNDRDDEKYESSHEESEYHFSDEDVSYEVENETSKQTAASEGEPKQSLVSRLSQSKRMLISLGVFLVLVFVVYKMVTPTTSVPTTNIATAPTPAPNVAMPPAPGQTQASATSAPMTAAAPSVQPALPAQPVQQTAAAAPAMSNAMPAAPAAPTTVAQSAPLPSTTAQAATQATIAQPPAAEQKPPVAVTLPAVIPVQTTVPAYPNQPVVATTAVPVETTQSSLATLTAESEKLMGQLQAQYNQQVNEFTNQNKALQDQVQALTARVSVMESQLNQLVQALTRQHQNSSMVAPAATPMQPQAVEAKIAYNVQAIIPGRAWLKSDNGETLTVAEGDIIKGVGRVTKIDPYDGLVEINTGNKAVSLSYGNGG